MSQRSKNRNDEIVIIGTSFLKEYEKEEKKYFGQTLRTLTFVGAAILVVILMFIAMVLELPNSLVMFFSTIIAVPAVWYGMNVRKLLGFDARLHFFLLKKRRVYQTERNIEKGEE